MCNKSNKCKCKYITYINVNVNECRTYLFSLSFECKYEWGRYEVHKTLLWTVVLTSVASDYSADSPSSLYVI